MIMLTRGLKRLVAKIGIAALLFMQLAVAAYACPTLVGSNASMTVAMDSYSPMQDCEKQNEPNLNLCLQHCQADSQSVQTTPYASIPAIAPLVVAIVAPVEQSFTPTVIDGSLPYRQTSPPPLIRFGVLRI